MKRTGFLLIFLLFLLGCQKEAPTLDRAMELRSRLLQAQNCSFDTQITADYADKLFTFDVHCEGDSQGNLQFTITAPESVSGITGSLSDTGGNLCFDNIALGFEPVAEGQISPAAAPWIFLKTLRSGYLSSAGMEGELLRLSVDDSFQEDALHLDIWLDPEDRPCRAEILYKQRRILSLDVKNFVIS